MTLIKKIGRPKKPEVLELLDLKSFQSDITIFKNGLQDYLEDEDADDRKVYYTKRFLLLDDWKQNLFIVYLIFKQSKRPVSQMADILHADRTEILKTIRQIKTEIKQK